MESFSKGAEGLGKSIGGASQGGAAGILDLALSPTGLTIVIFLVLVAMWMGRK